MIACQFGSKMNHLEIAEQIPFSDTITKTIKSSSNYYSKKRMD